MRGRDQRAGQPLGRRRAKGGAPEEPGDHALGRSRGGYGTKIVLVTDGHGHPLSAVLLPGQAHESTALEPALRAVRIGRRTRPGRLAGDKGFSYPRVRRWLRRRRIAQLTEARRLHPEWDFPLAELGRLYLARGWPEQAAAVMEKAPACMLGQHSDCAFVYGLALSRLGQFKETLAACMLATKADRAHGEAWDLAADCAFRLGDKVAGRAYARTARHLGCWQSYRTWIARLGE